MDAVSRPMPSGISCMRRGYEGPWSGAHNFLDYRVPSGRVPARSHTYILIMHVVSSQANLDTHSIEGRDTPLPNSSTMTSDEAVALLSACAICCKSSANVLSDCQAGHDRAQSAFGSISRMQLTTHQRDAVVGVDAREDLVDHGDVRAVGRHKAPDVCHVHDERDLFPSSTHPREGRQ